MERGKGKGRKEEEREEGNWERVDRVLSLLICQFHHCLFSFSYIAWDFNVILGTLNFGSRSWVFQKRTVEALSAWLHQGRIQGGAMGAMPPPQDAEVAFWSTAIILIQ